MDTQKNWKQSAFPSPTLSSSSGSNPPRGNNARIPFPSSILPCWSLRFSPVCSLLSHAHSFQRRFRYLIDSRCQFLQPERHHFYDCLPYSVIATMLLSGVCVCLSLTPTIFISSSSLFPTSFNSSLLTV